MGQFIDFKWVVANADVEAVLAGLGCEIARQSGEELRVHCPLHDDQTPSCSINRANKLVKCFAGCIDGDILELVAQAQETDKRTAATRIADWSGIELADPAGRRGRSPAPSGRGRKAPLKDTAKAKPVKDWQPFTTRLKLDRDHGYGQRFDPALIGYFDMGFQDRGLLKDRWCVPIHDAAGQQLGYCGRHVGDTLDKTTPRWLFPEGFPKAQVLFNLHRVLSGDVHDGALIVVEGIGDAIRLHGLGLPVVACFGTSLSQDQTRLIAEHEVSQVLVLFDGDAPGRKAAPVAVAALAQHVFVRDVVLPETHDPESVPEVFLSEQLWWL